MRTAALWTGLAGLAGFQPVAVEARLGADFSLAGFGARHPLVTGLHASDDRLSAADALAYDPGTNSDHRLTAYLRKAF